MSGDGTASGAARYVAAAADVAATPPHVFITMVAADACRADFVAADTLERHVR